LPEPDRDLETPAVSGIIFRGLPEEMLGLLFFPCARKARPNCFAPRHIRDRERSQFSFIFSLGLLIRLKIQNPNWLLNVPLGIEADGLLQDLALFSNFAKTVQCNREIVIRRGVVWVLAMASR